MSKKYAMEMAGDGPGKSGRTPRYLVKNTFFPGKRSVHRVPGRTDAPLAGVFFHVTCPGEYDSI